MDREKLSSAFSAVKLKYGISFDLKRKQTEVLLALLKKKSVFALLPTGFGKSQCFILPPLILDEVNPGTQHMAVVVSPLRSLMMNQVNNLKEIGVKACAVLKYSEMEQHDIDGILRGSFSVVFISPESLELHPWRNLLKQPAYKKGLALVACDEAHCISQWGSDFRPTYKNVSLLRSLCSKTPFLFLTATCTQKIKEDILDCLVLQERQVETVAVVPDRENIFLHFLSKAGMKYEDELAWFVDILIQFGPKAPKQ